MHTPETNLPKIHKRPREVDAWMYGSVVVALLSGSIFHDDLAIVAGLIVATAMLEIWMVKSGVRKFFCRLFLVVPGLFFAVDAMLLWRKL